MNPSGMCASPWALLPGAWQQIANGFVFSAAMPSVVPSPLLKGLGDNHSVAVLPIRGVILPYESVLARLLGATCLDQLTEDFCRARDNPDIRAIILDLDSPGGMVTGVHAFSQQVFAARSVKPIIAMVSGMAASAAYWIAASATQVFLDPTASVGSIGVVMTVTDNTEQQKRAGVCALEIVSSQSPYKRLNAATEAGREPLQAQVDQLAAVFVEAVAEYRQVSVSTVLTDFGQGGLLVGAAAVTQGLADGLASLPTLFHPFISTTTGVPMMSSMTQEPFPPALLQTEPPPPFIAQAVEPPFAPQAREQPVPEIRDEPSFQAGFAAGKAAEQQRIQSIEAQALPGHEALIERLKQDGVSTGSDAAMHILAVQKAQRAQLAAQLEEDAPAPLPPMLESSLRVHAALPLEAQCEAEWQTSPQIREEFYSFEGYLAYRKAEARGCIQRFHRSEEAV